MESMTKNTLHLTLRKQWFAMIKSGVKREEYREIKPYWKPRLEGKNFNQVCFHNGYQKDSPYILIECLGINKGSGNTNWGAVKDTEYYVIQLGKLLVVDGVQVAFNHPGKSNIKNFKEVTEIDGNE